MEETLESRNVSTTFVEVVDDTVYIGYESSQTDASKLFTELQAVVHTVLEHEPGTAVEGAIFHTDHPVIGTWHVEAAWADRRQNDDLSETGLASRVLRTFDTIEF